LCFSVFFLFGIFISSLFFVIQTLIHKSGWRQPLLY
jgi:hypothetical protein